MDGVTILGLVTKAYDLVSTLGMGIINLLGKSKPDQTELAKLKQQYELALADLDFKLKQAQIWMQEKLIALEQATGARWRTPLILASGVALVLAALNNILAAVYFDWAHPIDMTSAPMGVLAGMFILLVVGDPAMLIDVFKPKKKE